MQNDKSKIYPDYTFHRKKVKIKDHSLGGYARDDRFYLTNTKGDVLFETDAPLIASKKLLPKKAKKLDQETLNFLKQNYQFLYKFTKFTNSHVIFSNKITEEIIIRVNGGVHTTDLSLNRTEKKKYTLGLLKAFGYKPHKRKRGGYDVYINDK